MKSENICSYIGILFGVFRQLAPYYDENGFLYGLKILEFNRPNKTFLDPMESEDVENRLKMLFIVSYYGSWKGFSRLQSREQFDDFLSRHNISENDLRVYREYECGNKVPPRHIKQFLPDPVYCIEIRIVEEKLNESIGKIYYDYFLPGFSLVEVLKAWERRHLVSHSTI